MTDLGGDLGEYHGMSIGSIGIFLFYWDMFPGGVEMVDVRREILGQWWYLWQWGISTGIGIPIYVYHQLDGDTFWRISSWISMVGNGYCQVRPLSYWGA